MKVKVLVSLLLGATLMMSVGCSQSTNSNLSKVEQQVEASTTPEGSTEVEPEASKTPIVTETLPIGSVVKVEGNDQKYMIMVHDYIVEEMPDVTFQYAACLYPEGNITAKPAMAFNNEDISEVLCKGLVSMDEAGYTTYEVKTGYLPLGTVIEVSGADAPLMIFGRYQQLQGEEEPFDYVACEYPVGNVNPEESYVFNREYITGIYFLGYIDEEEESFRKELPER